MQPSDVNSVNGKTGIVTLTQDDVLPGETYTQFAKTDKEKLDAIDDEATKNTITMNGAENKNPSFYAPTDSGTVGQVLVSGGENAAPTWQAMPNHLQKYSINNPVIAAAGGRLHLEPLRRRRMAHRLRCWSRSTRPARTRW